MAKEGILGPEIVAISNLALLLVSLRLNVTNPWRRRKKARRSNDTYADGSALSIILLDCKQWTRSLQTWRVWI